MKSPGGRLFGKKKSQEASNRQQSEEGSKKQLSLKSRKLSRSRLTNKEKDDQSKTSAVVSNFKKGSKTTNERLDKIEKYLQDRWNWLGLPRKPLVEPKKEAPKQKDFSRNLSPHRYPTLIAIKKKEREASPDDHLDGESVNKLCAERDRLRRM